MAKSTKKSTRSPAKAEPEARSSSGGNRLLGAVWHDGKMYDPKKPGDQAAFAKLVESDKAQSAKQEKAGTKPGDKNYSPPLDLQRLADEGVVSGFGVKSKSKGKGRAATDNDDEIADADPDAEAGGGVDALDEQAAREDEEGVETREDA